MGKRFQKAIDLPAWRRIAANAWRPPREPIIHGSLEVDAGPSLQHVAKLREETGVRVTITHLVAKAVARAVASMPEVNGIVSRGSLRLRPTVDVFIQVALDEGLSLSGALIKEADRKSVEVIARELAAKVEKIRSHTDESLEKTTRMMSVVPAPLLGPLLRMLSWAQYDVGLDLSRMGIDTDPFGSAMVTNVGMFGLQQGFPPPFPLGRTAIVILVGEVTRKPVAVNDEVVVRPTLGLHATLDHRIIDGYHAGVLAASVRESLTKPEVML
jgi:pyruvate dehydrogenase E2 component (dihydrolipoamide acetyltransferase)